MKKIIAIAVFSIVAQNVFCQGLNNDFEYDREDLNFILSKLGFTTFKFPIKQNRNQYIDFVIEEYTEGKLSNSFSFVNKVKQSLSEFGLDYKNYIKPNIDSLKQSDVFLHRFYLQKTDTLLEVNIKSHSLTSHFKLNLHNLGPEV